MYACADRYSERRIQRTTPHLYVSQRARLLLAALGGEEADGRGAGWIVLHLERDRPTGLGPATHLVELESHQRLYQRALPRCLVANYEHGRCIEWLVEVLIGDESLFKNTG